MLRRMDTKIHVAPENPQDSDDDLSDNDDQVEDPDFHPTQADDAGDSSFESLDVKESPSTSRASEQPPHKKSRKGKQNLKTATLEKPGDNPDRRDTAVPNTSTRRIWKQEDIEEFQILEAVHSSFQYFEILFTDDVIEHIARHTNLYSAQELVYPITNSPSEMEHFLAILLLMGVLNFPSLEDYWHHESHFNVIADIMLRKRFQLLS
ncbi:hypothetical protein PAMA_021595 [Pampus argenteus]